MHICTYACGDHKQHVTHAHIARHKLVSFARVYSLAPSWASSGSMAAIRRMPPTLAAASEWGGPSRCHQLPLSTMWVISLPMAW